MCQVMARLFLICLNFEMFSWCISRHAQDFSAVYSIASCQLLFNVNDNAPTIFIFFLQRSFSSLVIWGVCLLVLISHC